MTPILSFKGGLNHRDLQYTIERLLKEFDLPLHVRGIEPYLDRMQATNKVGLVVLWLISLITGIVLLLTTMSLHSLLKQVVESRQREFAIHMALGAKRRNIFHLLYKDSYHLIVFGLLASIPVFMFIFSLLDKYFIEISIVDVFFVVQAVWLMMGLNFLFLLAIARHLSLRSPAILLRAN